MLATLTKDQTLQEFILTQLRYAELDELDKGVVLHVVGNLDKHGYLCCSDEEIAEACECKLNQVKDFRLARLILANQL